MHAIGQTQRPSFAIGIVNPHAYERCTFLLGVSCAMQKIKALRFESRRHSRDFCRIKYATAGVVHAGKFDDAADLKGNGIIGLPSAGNGGPGAGGGEGWGLGGVRTFKIEEMERRGGLGE